MTVRERKTDPEKVQEIINLFDSLSLVLIENDMQETYDTVARLLNDYRGHGVPQDTIEGMRLYHPLQVALEGLRISLFHIQQLQAGDTDFLD